MYINGRGSAVLLALFTIVSSWIIGLRMRRKIRKDLGRKATEEDLTSINTWMAVDEVEEKKKESDPFKPD